MQLDSKDALNLWYAVTLAGMRRDQPDLTTRQMAVLLHVYLAEPPHTVRGLAWTLNASKPAITRALDRLSDLNLIRRKRDESDKRNVLVQRTVNGSVFLREFGDMAAHAAETV